MSKGANTRVPAHSLWRWQSIYQEETDTTQRSDVARSPGFKQEQEHTDVRYIETGRY